MGLPVGVQAQFSSPAGGSLAAGTVPEAQLMQPAELVKLLNAGGSERPVVFQVGSYVMFQQAHIPNSGFAGPGSRPNGLMLLTKLTGPLKKNQPIVIYCGCCPLFKCPNIRPAFKELAAEGFTNIKVLNLKKNLQTDWVDKNYPMQDAR